MTIMKVLPIVIKGTGERVDLETVASINFHSLWMLSSALNKNLAPEYDITVIHVMMTAALNEKEITVPNAPIAYFINADGTDLYLLCMGRLPVYRSN